MIKEESITKKFPTNVPSYVEKEIIQYTCSDGTIFTNEHDENPRYKKTGKQLAQEHEKELTQIKVSKEELNFYELTKYSLNNKVDNLGYDSEFYFYFHKSLSDLSIDILNHKLIYYEGYGYKTKVSKDTEEGWYIVQQELHIEESANGDYIAIDHFLFEKLDDYKLSLLEKISFYNAILSEAEEQRKIKTLVMKTSSGK